MAGGVAGLFIALSLCAASQQAGEAQNLLRNPSFEALGSTPAAIESWTLVTGRGAAIAVEDAVAGERLLSTGPSGLVRVRQLVAYRQAQPSLLRLSAQVRGKGLVELRLRATALQQRESAHTITVQRASAGWREIAMVAEVPAGMDRLWVELVADGPAEFDAVELVPFLEGVPPAQPETASFVDRSRQLDLALQSKDFLQREQTCIVLACDPEWRELLLEVVHHDGPLVAGELAIVRALARVQDDALLRKLPPALAQPASEEEARTLERVAREYGVLRAYQPLLAPQLTEQAHPTAQDAAMRVLADARDARFFAGMKELYFAAELPRRAAWLKAAASFESVEALEELAAQVRRARGVERELAERAFLQAARSGDQVRMRSWLLEQGLAHRDPFIRRACLVVLGPEFEPVEISAALRLTRDSDVDVLRTLIPILGHHPSQASERALQGFVGHRNSLVAADALRAYWQLRDGDSGVRSFARGVIVGEGQWAVQQAAIELLARDERNLPRQRLRKLAVESPDWHVSRAAAEVLQARGEALPEDAVLAPDQPQTLFVVALDPTSILEGLPSSVGPWLKLRESLAALNADDQLSLAGVPPVRWRPAVFESGSARVEAFDAWFASRASSLGLGSMGGLREALRKACQIDDATELVVVLDADFPDGSLEDWLDLAADFRRWNAHQGLKLRFLTADDGGRISLALREFVAAD